MSAVDRLQKFLSEKGVEKKSTCAQCNHWKVHKADKLEREHASQGRALCTLDKSVTRPFLHHTHPSCSKISLVDLDLEIKRINYLKGK
jgi:hypothetical protein